MDCNKNVFNKIDLLVKSLAAPQHRYDVFGTLVVNQENGLALRLLWGILASPKILSFEVITADCETATRKRVY